MKAMQFNTHLFVIYYLPIVILLYFFFNKINLTWGKVILIVSGILFYSLGRWDMFMLLCISMFFNFGASLLISRLRGSWQKSILILSIFLNVLFLLSFKYFNFFLATVNSVLSSDIPFCNIILPLGISFYTFQQISYVAAVYNGEVKENDAIDYLVYILYFPKLLMGPLMEPQDFLDQINDSGRKRLDANNIACGIKLFSIGLIKKVLIADTFAKSVDWTFINLGKASSLECILTVLFYSLQIYFDFSGYSDMAIGISMMLNIDLPINFDSPYKALSIRDFWKRWHISLTKFLTKYIYIPLGGSKKGTTRTYLNTMIVFAISGLWHGANWTFVVWGVVHGLLSCWDRLSDNFMKKIWFPIRWLLTFVAVSILWLLFRSNSFGAFSEVLRLCFVGGNYTISNDFVEAFGSSLFKPIINILQNIGIYIMPIHVMVLLSVVTMGVCLLPANAYTKRKELSVWSMCGSAIAFACAMLCLSGESMFVYFGF